MAEDENKRRRMNDVEQSQNNILKVVGELEFDVEINSLFLGDFDLFQQKVNISFSRRRSFNPAISSESPNKHFHWFL